MTSQVSAWAAAIAIGAAKERLDDAEDTLDSLRMLVYFAQGVSRPEPKPVYVIPEEFTLSAQERIYRRERFRRMVVKSWTNYDHRANQGQGVLIRGHLVHRLGSYHGERV